MFFLLLVENMQGEESEIVLYFKYKKLLKINFSTFWVNFKLKKKKLPVGIFFYDFFGPIGSSFLFINM